MTIASTEFFYLFSKNHLQYTFLCVTINTS
nr:MAG TPA: hypothetical protein [Caudoviricetes sp.]